MSIEMCIRDREHALARFRFVYERYLQGTDAKIYFAAIPDKNYFLAEQYGYPALDYEEFIQKFADGMDYAQTVDLTAVSYTHLERAELIGQQDLLRQPEHEPPRAVGCIRHAVLSLIHICPITIPSLPFRPF